jgi:hypothetical protein
MPTCELQLKERGAVLGETDPIRAGSQALDARQPSLNGGVNWRMKRFPAHFACVSYV